MSNGYFVDAKKVASGGYFHLLQSPFSAAAAKEHCPNAPFLPDVTTGVVQAQLVTAFTATATAAAKRTMKIRVMR